MEVDQLTLARARLAIWKAVQGGYLYDPNITLIDFGFPETNGKIQEDQLAIRFHVHQKMEQPELEVAVEMGYTRPVPPTLDGFPTDVPEGTYRPHQFWRVPSTSSNARSIANNPLRGGISLGNERQYSYGTLGGLVLDRQTRQPYLLSNWHVLAGDWLARKGQRIVQPGRLDGGTLFNTVGALARHGMDANIDAAVAEVNTNRQWINDQVGLGPVTGLAKPTLGMRVVKSGRRTGVTNGRVTAVEGLARMNYSGLDRIIRHVVTIEPEWLGGEVSGPGDSGSLWLEADSRRATGLHFAGSNQPERSLAIDIFAVLDALQVDLLITVPAVLRSRRVPTQETELIPA